MINIFCPTLLKIEKGCNENSEKQVIKFYVRMNINININIMQKIT